MAREFTVKATITADTKSAERNTRALAQAQQELGTKLDTLRAKYDAGEISARSFIRQQATLERQTARLSDQMATGATRTQALGQGLAASLGPAVALAGGIGTLVAGLRAAVTASAEQEAALNRLRVALADLGPEADGVVEALTAQAAAIQSTTTFADDAVNAAQARIAAFTSERAVIELLTKASTDLAAARGIDLLKASDTLIKAYVGEGTALKKLGIEVEGVAGSTERLRSVTEGVADAFGGQATAQLDTASGAFARLGNAIGEVFEASGDLATKSDTVRGIIQTLTAAFDVAGATISDFASSTDDAATAQDRQAQASERQRAALDETRRLLAEVSREAEKNAAAYDAIAEAQGREIAASDRFAEGLRRIGVRLATDVNGEIDANNRLVKQSAELYAAGVISLADYQAIQDAAAASNQRLAGTTRDAAVATSELSATTQQAAAGVTSIGSAAVITTGQLDAMIATMGRAAAVAAALEQGGVLSSNGRRIRVRGGSRLTSDPGFGGSGRSRLFSNLGSLV